jgi:hypothetical protein
MSSDITALEQLPSDAETPKHCYFTWTGTTGDTLLPTDD